MPLSVNLRHLAAHDLKLEGELPAEELDLDLGDDMVRAEKPLAYDVQVQQVERNLLVQGTLSLGLQCQCVRCLKPFERELRLDNWELHLPLEGEEKAEVISDSVDLTPYVREDILLEFPRHPLCQADCSGLPGMSPGEWKKTNGTEVGEQDSSAWGALDKLKF